MDGSDQSMSPSGALRRKRIGLVLGPAVCAAMLLAPAPAGLGDPGWRVAAAAVLMAVWWITEAIPIPATSLVPVAMLPLIGAGSIREATTPYADPVIYLFLGGFMIALAMERWSLHRRIALHVIRRVGTSPRALVAGFMLAAALLSMWVSNTATALMMLPVGISVVELAERTGGAGTRERFAVCLLLGIAYGCNIGGMGTLVGTPPNVLMAGFFEQEYGRSIGFAEWLKVGLPVVALGLPLAFLVLTRVTNPIRIRELPGARETVESELTDLGPFSRGEAVVAVVFGLTATLWITRPLLEGWIPGLSDAGIAIVAALALFVIPVRLSEGEFAMDWRTARRLPWGTLLLFGGGLSLAGAVTRTGLSLWVGESLAGVGSLPLVLVVLVVTTVVVFLTELTSNTATAATFLPVIAALALGIGQDPMTLALPAVLGASCAFMLPVATPPNAIVYGSGRVSIPQMARAGFVLNLVFIAVITALAYSVFGWVMGGGAAGG
jgi:sodium-dependent dicarboxylate transporter 2/3/5